MLLTSARYTMLHVHTWLRDDIGGSTPQEHESFFLVDKIINLPGNLLLVQVSVTEHPLFLCVCLSCSPPMAVNESNVLLTCTYWLDDMSLVLVCFI